VFEFMAFSIIAVVQHGRLSSQLQDPQPMYKFRCFEDNPMKPKEIWFELAAQKKTRCHSHRVFKRYLARVVEA